MDYYTILAQREHIVRDIVGQRVELCSRAGTYTLFLSFGNGCALKLAATPDMPYVVTVEPRFIPRKNVHAWHQTRFESRVLTDVTVTPGDRILTFTVEGGTRLIFELTGRHANIVIVGPDGIIAGALRQVTGRESGVRTIGPGIPYIPPPSRDFPDLVRGVLPVLLRCLNTGEGTVGTALRQNLTCGSRYFAMEVCTRAGISPDISLEDIGQDDLFGLIETAAQLAGEIEKGGRGGCVVFRRDGLPHDVFPMPITVPDMNVAVFDTLDEAVLTYARDREIELERRSLRLGIIAALATEERRVRSTIVKVEHERGSGVSPDDLERRANIILANLNRIKRGQTTAVLPDIYSDGEVAIDLNPALNGAENAEQLFRRARKRRAASKLAVGRLASLAGRLARIEDDRKAADTTTDIRELRSIAAIHTRERQSRREDEDRDELFPRRFISPSGLTIYVGRNDRENDELVRWAHKRDLWFHAQYIGGSHVILRSPGKQAPDRKSIELAAAIAAYYSKTRTAAIVPVVCTQVKYVTKRKGQGPGKVTYTREEVLFVEPGKP